MTSTKRDIRAPKCDACLWSPTDCKVVSAAVASVTCLHCFCVQCIRGLIQMAQKRKDKEKTLWFRCPAGPCGILIQSNQLRELSSKNLPTPLQYLFKSHNANKAIASLQKAASFHLEANSGHIKLQQQEIDRRAKMISKLEAKIESVEKKYTALKAQLKERERSASNAPSPFRRKWNNYERENGLSFLDENMDETDVTEKTLLF